MEVEQTSLSHMLFVITEGTKIPAGSEAFICELGSNVPYAYMCDGQVDELMDAPVLPFMATNYPQVLGLSLLNLTCEPHTFVTTKESLEKLAGWVLA